MRFISAYISIEFSEFKKKFKEEFDKLGSESDDPIGQYIKLAKARGETKDTDPILMELLIALHRKVDELTAYVKNKQKEFIPLKYNSETEGIGFEFFKIKDNFLKKISKRFLF